MSHTNNRNSLSPNAGKVVHNYTDRSREPDPTPSPSSSHTTTVNNTANNKHGNAVEHNFPMKLHYMLSNMDADGTSHIVSWQPHGRCFMVHDLKEFVASLLPLWFRQSKFASFQRQLNLYGFQRITQGQDKGGYYHEYFLRSRPLLCQNIVRTKVKGKGARKASSPETEPRLYDYPWMPADANKPGKAGPAAAANDALALSAQTAASLAPTSSGGTPSLASLTAMASAGNLGGGANHIFGLGDALGLLSTSYDTTQGLAALYGQQQQQNALLLNSLLPSNSIYPLAGAGRYVPIAPAPTNSSALFKATAPAPFAAASAAAPSSSLHRFSLTQAEQQQSILEAIKAQAGNSPLLGASTSAAPGNSSSSSSPRFTTPGPMPLPPHPPM